MNILTILGMVVATSVVTLLCMRFGITMTNTPVHIDKVNHTTSDRSITYNRGKLLVGTIPPDTAVELNATDKSFSLNQKGGWISRPGSTSTVLENKASKNYSNIKHLQQENSKLLSDIGLVRTGGFLAETSTSSNIEQAIDFRDASIDINSYNRHDNINTMSNNNENKYEDITGNTNMNQLNRQISQRKLNHNRQLNTNIGKYTTMAEGDNSNGYQNAYDLTYNAGDYGFKEYESPTYETGWTSAGEPQQTPQGSFWSGSSGSWEPPPYGIEGGYSTDQGPSSKPLDRPSKKPTKNDQNALQPKINNVNWKTIGMLALLKLSLAKLQAIGFLKALFLLGFSFKMYMIAVIFKFMLMMKLMKFFKILLLPLFLVRLLPSLIQLLMIPGRILDLLRRLADSNNVQGNQLGGLLPSQPGGLLPSQPGGLLPNQPGGLLPNRPGLLPNRPAAGTPGITRRSDKGKDIPINKSTTVNHNIIGKINYPLFKLEDTYLINAQKNDSIPIANSTLENFQKLLESEKCVERIACQISVAEKKGNIPVWINWALHRVQKLIPNDKLESYLKAYKDVNNELNAKLSVPENWATWCLERYDCNSSDITTNESNARK